MMEDHQAWIQRRQPLLPWTLVTSPETDTVPGVKALIDWLNINIRQPRKFRQAQMYIHGPPMIGKTTMIEVLRQHLRVFMIPRDEDFMDEWENGTFDIAILDEFKAHKKIQWLNSWLDGSLMPLRQKGRQTLKSQNIPTLILSNYTLRECYHKKSSESDVGLDALESRLSVIYIGAPYTICIAPAPVIETTVLDAAPTTTAETTMESSSTQEMTPPATPTTPTMQRSGAVMMTSSNSLLRRSSTLSQTTIDLSQEDEDLSDYERTE